MVIFCVACSLVAACWSKVEEGGKGMPAEPRTEPDMVVVDHILIGVAGALPVRRSAAEAKALTNEILGKLKDGADWDALKSAHSDDPPPGGPYTMTNFGKPTHGGAMGRGDMVRSFGDVSFGLDVGEIGVAAYQPAARASPFGYHIIKRIR
jgi:hypothetical protein